MSRIDGARGPRVKIERARDGVLLGTICPARRMVTKEKSKSGAPLTSYVVA